MLLWDNNYSNTPVRGDERKYGAKHLRELKLRLSERGELEHNFKAGTRPFHKAGLCTILFIGTTAEIAALASPTEGCVAYDTTLKGLKVYTSGVWTLLDSSHSALGGLTEDDHTQYFNLDKAGQVITENLGLGAGVLINGVDVTTLYSSLNSRFLVNTDMVDLSFAGTEIRRHDGGSFITDGFALNDTIWSSNALNLGPFRITTLTDTVLVVQGTIIDHIASKAVLYKMREGFGAWDGTYAINTTYGPEAKDCFVSAVGYVTLNYLSYNGITYNGNLSGMLGVKVNSTSPPTTKRGTTAEQIHGRYLGLVVPVKAGEYWSVYTESKSVPVYRPPATVTASVTVTNIKKMDIN